MEILPWKLNVCSGDNCYTVNCSSVWMYWRYSFLLRNNIFNWQSVVRQYGSTAVRLIREDEVEIYSVGRKLIEKKNCILRCKFIKPVGNIFSLCTHLSQTWFFSSLLLLHHKFEKWIMVLKLSDFWQLLLYSFYVRYS